MPNLIGTAPNQVPVNGLLGTLAFQDSDTVNITGGTIGGVPVSTIADTVLRGEQADTIASSSSVVLRGGATNLLTYSEDFTQAAWGKTRATVTGDVVVSPNGTITGDKLIATAVSGTHYVINGAVTASTAYTFSIYAKQGEESLFSTAVAYNSTGATFDLATGTVSSVNIGSASITAVGNGWYRCIWSFTPASNSNIIVQLRDRAATFTGDGTSGVYVWGAQLEASSTVGAYLKTEATAVSTAYAAPIESPNGVAVPLLTSMTPARNGDMTFQLTSNTSLTIKVKGSDGTVRSVVLTLA